MKFKRIITLFFICIVFLSFSSKAFAQEETNDLSQFTADDYLELALPPIDTLFSRIETTSKANFLEYRTKEGESLLKSEKRRWLNYLKFSSAYQYGYLGGESFVQGNLVPDFYQTTQNAQNYYHIGVSISIPFDDLIDRGNKVKQLKLRVRQLKYEKEAYLDDQKITIIELYSAAIQYLSLMKITLDAKNLSKVESTIGEQDFINGKISPSELSKSKHSEAVATSEYERLRAELNIALLKLEIICNYKFTKHKK